MKTEFIVSACLAGFPCRYDGKAQTDPAVQELVRSGKARPVCPECLGGLPTPRMSAEIADGSGEDVLAGNARVIARSGNDEKDVTEAFVNGAEKALSIAKRCGASKAILKANSPSCGCGMIYDGTFSGRKKKGNGVAAALLLSNGIDVHSV